LNVRITWLKDIGVDDNEKAQKVSSARIRPPGFARTKARVNRCQGSDMTVAVELVGCALVGPVFVVHLMTRLVSGAVHSKPDSADQRL
jgi:hypothetical protein